MHPLYVAQPLPHVPVWLTVGTKVPHRKKLIRLLAAGPRSTVGHLLPSRYLCRTILVTLYSIV